MEKMLFNTRKQLEVGSMPARVLLHPFWSSSMALDFKCVLSAILASRRRQSVLEIHVAKINYVLLDDIDEKIAFLR